MTIEIRELIIEARVHANAPAAASGLSSSSFPAAALSAPHAPALSSMQQRLAEERLVDTIARRVMEQLRDEREVLR